MFRQSTIGRIQKRLATALTETCTIKRETDARGTMNERTHTLETVAPLVPCRVISVGAQATGETRDVGAQEALIDEYRLIVPVGTDFAVNDVVEMTEGEEVYQVTKVVERHSQSTHAEALLVRQRDGDG